MEADMNKKPCDKCTAMIMMVTLRSSKRVAVNLPPEVRIVEIPQGSGQYGIVYTYTAHEPVCSKTKKLAAKRRASMGSSR